MQHTTKILISIELGSVPTYLNSHNLPMGSYQSSEEEAQEADDGAGNHSDLQVSPHDPKSCPRTTTTLFVTSASQRLDMTAAQEAIRFVEESTRRRKSSEDQYCAEFVRCIQNIEDEYERKSAELTGHYEVQLNKILDNHWKEKQDMKTKHRDLEKKMQEINQKNRILNDRLGGIIGNELDADGGNLENISEKTRHTTLRRDYERLMSTEWNEAKTFLDAKYGDDEEAHCRLLCFIMKDGFDEAKKHLSHFKKLLGHLLKDPVIEDGGESIMTEQLQGTSLEDDTWIRLPSSLRNEVLAYFRKEGDSTHTGDKIAKIVKKRVRDKLKCLQPKSTETNVSDIPPVNPKALRDYVEQCCQIAWQMHIVQPPLIISTDDKTFDKKTHEQYYCDRGNAVDISYYVRPALLESSDHRFLVQGIVCTKVEEANFITTSSHSSEGVIQTSGAQINQTATTDRDVFSGSKLDNGKLQLSKAAKDSSSTEIRAKGQEGKNGSEYVGLKSFEYTTSQQSLEPREDDDKKKGTKQNITISICGKVPTPDDGDQTGLISLTKKRIAPTKSTSWTGVRLKTMKRDHQPPKTAVAPSSSETGEKRQDDSQGGGENPKQSTERTPNQHRDHQPPETAIAPSSSETGEKGQDDKNDSRGGGENPRQLAERTPNQHRDHQPPKTAEAPSSSETGEKRQDDSQGGGENPSQSTERTPQSAQISLAN